MLRALLGAALAGVLLLPAASAGVFEDAARLGQATANQALAAGEGAKGEAIAAAGNASTLALQAATQPIGTAEALGTQLLQDASRQATEGLVAAIALANATATQARQAPEPLVAEGNRRLDTFQTLLPPLSDYLTTMVQSPNGIMMPILHDANRTLATYTAPMATLGMMQFENDTLTLGAPSYEPPDPDAFAGDLAGLSERTAGAVTTWTLAQVELTQAFADEVAERAQR